MLTFIGDINCKLDNKGRLALPASFKKAVDRLDEGTFIVKKDIFEQCLVLYPVSEWNHQIELINSKINPYNREHNQFVREFFRGTAELTLDASSRVLIPKRLLDLVQIDKEIVLAGQYGKIEIWAKDVYEACAQSQDDFAELAQKVMAGAQ